jgi:phosphatidate phosphatase LPIN
VSSKKQIFFLNDILRFRSDVFGHIFPLVGKDWSHEGIAEFFKAIQENGYQFIYLSARAIGQSGITRNFLRNIKQCEFALPNGPLLISPDTLVTALYRFV